MFFLIFNWWFSDNQSEPDIMPTSPGSSRPGRMTSSKMTPLWVQRWNCRRYMAGVRIRPIQVEFLHRSGNSSSGEPLLRWNWVRGSGGTKLWAHRMLSSTGQKNILVTMMSPVWKCLTLASPAGGIKNNSVAENKENFLDRLINRWWGLLMICSRAFDSMTSTVDPDIMPQLNFCFIFCWIVSNSFNIQRNLLWGSDECDYT